MYGKAVYFSSRSINSHSYNGQNKEILGRGFRYIILSSIAVGNTLNLEILALVFYEARARSAISKVFQAQRDRKPMFEEEDLWPRPNFYSFRLPEQLPAP